TAPLDWEVDRRAADDTEIEGVVGVLPDVFGVYNQESAECLLQTGMEFVAVARVNRTQIARDTRRRHQRCEKRVVASRAGNNQILIEWRLHCSRVGNAKNRVGWLEIVRDSNPRLGLSGDGQAVVN